jgi:hypothetical protein
MRHETFTPAELKARLHKLQAQAAGIRNQEELDRILLSFPTFSEQVMALTALAKLPMKCSTCRKEHRALSFDAKRVNSKPEVESEA